MAKKAVAQYHISIRQACFLFQLSRTAYQYVPTTAGDSELIAKILSVANEFPHYGYWKIYYLLRDQGYVVNHKRVYRVYTQLGLTIRHRKRNNQSTLIEPIAS